MSLPARPNWMTFNDVVVYINCCLQPGPQAPAKAPASARLIVHATRQCHDQYTQQAPQCAHKAGGRSPLKQDGCALQRCSRHGTGGSNVEIRMNQIAAHDKIPQQRNLLKHQLTPHYKKLPAHTPSTTPAILHAPGSSCSLLAPRTSSELHSTMCLQPGSMPKVCCLIKETEHTACRRHGMHGPAASHVRDKAHVSGRWAGRRRRSRAGRRRAGRAAAAPR